MSNRHKGFLISGLALSFVSAAVTSFCFGPGCLPVSAQSMAAGGADVNRPIRDKWALVVGISEFANPQLNLKYSAKDARDFADYLVKEAGFAPDHVKVLLNKDATERRILSELGDRWLPRVANPDDLVVLFVSTHGSGAELDVGGQNYLVAYDTDVQDLYTTGVPMRRLAEDIKNRVHCERVVIFLDACHSGGAKSEAKGLVRTGVDASELAVGSGQLVIASSAEDQVSWESKNGANGVFTSALLESLRKKGQSTTIGEMFKDLKDKVQDQVLRERGRLQTPVMESKWQGNDLCIAATPVSRRPGLTLEPPVLKTSTQSSPAPVSAPAPVAPPVAPVAVTAVPPTAVIKPGILIVPGVSVGRTKIGMSKQEVEALLGRPGQENVDMFTYRTSDRRYFLSLRFSGDKVSEIAFSSPAFSTASGLSLESIKHRPDELAESGRSGSYQIKVGKGGGLSFICKEGGPAQFAIVHQGPPTDPQRWLADLNTHSGSATATAVSDTVRKTSPGSASTDNPNLLRPGHSLAKVNLGMSREQVLLLLGRPSDAKGSVMSYWTGDRLHFIAFHFGGPQGNSLTDILFTSPSFVTAGGINVANFETANAGQFGPAHVAHGRPAPIYTLKEGGLSFFKPTSFPRAIGWLHATDSAADDLAFMDEVRADLMPGKPRLQKDNAALGPRGRRRLNSLMQMSDLVNSRPY
ncbi:MAG: caspase family protein [Candidatus Melainabacteria bacterium]|nr:caspase family protein [Candidatus Melainabacteria bacterium]